MEIIVLNFVVKVLKGLLEGAQLLFIFLFNIIFPDLFIHLCHFITDINNVNRVVYLHFRIYLQGLVYFRFDS